MQTEINGLKARNLALGKKVQFSTNSGVLPGHIFYTSSSKIK